MIFEQGAAAYGNTLIFTAPDTTGNWWGDAAVQSSYGANEIVYCGYRFDPESQLYYVRNRTYNPVLGRWIQRDPIGYDGGPNPFQYASGGPDLWTDPDGRKVVNWTDRFTVHGGFFFAATFHVVLQADENCKQPTIKVVSKYWTGFVTGISWHFSGIVIPNPTKIVIGPCSKGSCQITVKKSYQIKVFDTVGVWKFGYQLVYLIGGGGHGFKINCPCPPKAIGGKLK